MRAFSRMVMLACLCAATTSISCIPCDHPLSDERTSIADEGLIGTWIVKSEGDQSNTLMIGRKVGAENILECVDTHFDDSQHVTIDRHDLFTTQVKSLRLVSYKHNRELGKNDPPSYSIWLIEAPDDDTLNVYMMNPKAINRAIATKKLSGEFISFDWVFNSHYRITSTPEELREYVVAEGKGCFDTEPVWAFVREK